MRYDTRVTVFLHNDGDCGDREWVVQLPSGWMWRDHAGPGPFTTLHAAGTYAKNLYPNHPDVMRCDPSVPELWDHPYAYPETPEVTA